MRKMVQGTEHEYTLYCRKMGTMGFDPHMMALDLLRDSDLHLAGEFITNGSRVYYDVGHFEVSTAETTNFHDVVIWEKAGEKVLDWLRRVMEEKYTGDMKIHAFKNNTSPDGTSYGSHENYCVSRDALMNETAIMLRHFVTSGVLQLMEDGKLSDVPRLKDPIRDLWQNVEIRNPEQWKVELEDGRTVSPIEIQRYYLGKIESIVVDD